LFLCVGTACAVVPEIDGAANVSLDDVAWRVKCDIWKYVARKILFPTDKRFKRANPYSFLAGWGARVHLTLAVDNTGALNPGATLIQTLPMSQSRSLGIGAGISTEAVSTTDYEFFLSFAEIHDQYKNVRGPVEGYCPAPRGLLLESDLRIDELFDRALEPVGTGTLRVGSHPSFGGNTAPATPGNQVPDYAAFEAAFEKLRGKHPGANRTISDEDFQTFRKSSGNQFEFLTKQALQDKTTVDDNKQAALLQETKAQSYIANIVKPVTDILGASFPACVKDLSQLRNEAIIEAALVSADKIEVDRATNVTDSKNALDALNKQMSGIPNKADSGLEAKVEDVLAQLNSCPSKKAPKQSPTVYDPLDLVSQTINFYIISSGSITPSWKLVNVSAPLASSFASLNRKDTNTLIIAFGRPDPTKGSTTSTAISNQILTSTLKDALQVRPTQ
jgi:hypothetical protein